MWFIRHTDIWRSTCSWITSSLAVGVHVLFAFWILIQCDKWTFQRNREYVVCQGMGRFYEFAKELDNISTWSKQRIKVDSDWMKSCSCYLKCTVLPDWIKTRYCIIKWVEKLKDCRKVIKCWETRYKISHWPHLQSILGIKEIKDFPR